jgi:hypothetical protein
MDRRVDSHWPVTWCFGGKFLVELDWTMSSFLLERDPQCKCCLVGALDRNKSFQEDTDKDRNKVNKHRKTDCITSWLVLLTRMRKEPGVSIAAQAGKLQGILHGRICAWLFCRNSWQPASSDASNRPKGADGFGATFWRGGDWRHERQSSFPNTRDSGRHQHRHV